jgi:CHAD domain-containing protein
MRASVERELKLAPGDGFVMPELGEPAPTRVFTSTYHDTVDLALARHGITLRFRSEDGSRLWQLKLPHGAHRLELEVPGRPARPPTELLQLLVAHLRGRELTPVARLRTRREVVHARDAEIVDDSVAVLDGQRVTRRFRELEVELVGEDVTALERIGSRLRDAGAVPRELRPKLFEALDLEPAVPPSLAVGARPLDALGLALADQYRHLLAHDPGTRHGVDPEDLHQLRVATRRLRAFLRAARPLVDGAWADALRDELGWLGGALGPARDLDVLAERLQSELAGLGAADGAAADLLAGLAAEREAARAAAVAALSTDRYLALLDRVEGAAHPPAGPGGRTLAELWQREWKRTQRTFARLGRTPPDAELHAARIKVKRARYAAELAQHELGKAGARFVDAAKALQDILGEHQDAVVAEERVLAWVAGGGDAGLGERVVAEERRRRAEARATWRDAWESLVRRAEKADR